MNAPLLNIGDVFCIQHTAPKLSPKYWKVTDIRIHKPGTITWDDSYLVISCSRTGKEYKQTNGFSTGIDQYFYKPFSIYSIITRNTQVGIKASTKGKESGKLKRRLNYCTAKVNAYNKEIHNIKEKLGYSTHEPIQNKCQPE